METKELLTITQVAQILKVSRNQVYIYINDTEHPLPILHLSERTPRVQREALTKWVAEKDQYDARTT